MKVNSIPPNAVPTAIPELYATPCGDIYFKRLSKKATNPPKYTIGKLTPMKKSGRKGQYVICRYMYKTYSWHRVIAQTFLPNPHSKPQVDHIDENPENNSVDNLRWCTPAENIQFSIESGNHACLKTRKAVKQLTLEGCLVATFKSKLEAGKVMNPNNPDSGRKNISNAIEKPTTAYGFLWELG